jgi:hypothetical protein
MIGVRKILLGPSYFYHRDLIKRSKGWFPSEIREYQDRRLRRLVRRYGDEITQKEDYQRYLRRYTPWNVPLLTHTVRTGGTSGQPFRFTADTFARRQKERAYRIGTQFVRYDTGDLAVDPVGRCANDNFPQASAIVGRSQETFVDSSGRRRSLFGYAFGDLDHGAFYDKIRDIQFVQDKAGSLRVRIVPTLGAQRDQIQRTFEQRIPMAQLEFEYVSVIERRPNGKRRYFVDSVNTDAAGPQ